ncbi:hypothetical protein IWW34DRAFT_814114 [Fusarium oxysporum f. sp. albedinis]|nr:hypothetical protein IWW34DRAFT_814114 [Fusarium oxysporum f. sp. albedinis]
MSEAVYSTPEWYLKAQDQDVSSDIGRLTIYHLGFKQAAEEKLIFPPIDFSTQPRAVLDVGTADGLWMRDTQSSIPKRVQGQHTFIGTDINTSFFPNTTMHGISYVKQDIKDPPPESWHGCFDLINMRMILIAAGSGSAQRAVVNEHIKLLKPGGWIQIGDCDRICPTPENENPRYHDMFACIRAVCQASGLDALEAPKMKSWLVEAGLEDVQEMTAMRAVGKRNTDEELGRLGVGADLIIAKGFAAGAKTLSPSLKPLPDERLDNLVIGTKHRYASAKGPTCIPTYQHYQSDWVKMSTLALPSSSLPPLFTLSKRTEADIFNVLHYLAAIYCPLSFPFSKELGDSKHAFAEVDSGYTSGNEDDEAELTPAIIRADVHEKSFAERWLTGLISRVESLEIFSSEETSQRALDQAAYIFESLFASALDEDDQNSPFLREFSFEMKGPGGDKKQISVQLNDGLAGTNDTDFEDVGLQSWGASIVFSDLMCTDPERFGLTNLDPTEHNRIIELGAGTGLVSLVLGKLMPALGINDSKIIATDYHPAVLSNLESNISINYPSPSPVQASPLDWADFSNSAPFDVPATMLFATDVVYAPEHARWLRDCATRLLSDDGVFWLLVTIRPNGKFAGIGDTVEAAFAERDRVRGKNGRRLDILERQKLDKRSGVGRGDESHYELFRIGWA